MSIRVNDFQWIPGKNDAEYIKLLESSRDDWERIAQKAIAKLKMLSRAQEPRCISHEEWDEWRHIPNGKREPLYAQDSTGGWWILNPSNWLEIVFLTGEIKIWNKRPTAAGCEAVKWDG